LDDDAYPASNALIEALKEFSNEEVACITMNLKDLRNGNYYDGDWLPKEKNEKRYWPIFVGCAFIVMIKRLPTTFRFPDKYFLYQHELPMAAEIYSNNKKILFSPEILAYHNFKEHTGYKVFSDSSAFRNNLNFICSYLPKPLMIFYFLQSILFYLSRSLRHKWFSEYKKIILQNKFWLKSRPIRFQYFVQLRPLHLFNYPLWSKIFK
ncbi:MAG TPA: hypothetical protein VI362_00595, partial [Ignavibacteriaceae bacterium]|nr:hypothetical protein [Ignavibacteriaceae bacterium]